MNIGRWLFNLLINRWRHSSSNVPPSNAPLPSDDNLLPLPPRAASLPRGLPSSELDQINREPVDQKLVDGLADAVIKSVEDILKRDGKLKEDLYLPDSIKLDVDAGGSELGSELAWLIMKNSSGKNYVLTILIQRCGESAKDTGAFEGITLSKGLKIEDLPALRNEIEPSIYNLIIGADILRVSAFHRATNRPT
jgi:hypothetical protein